MREYFLKTNRIGFSIWNKADINLASSLWVEKEVARFISANGVLTQQDIQNRLAIEIEN